MKLTPIISAIGVGGCLSAFGYAALRAHWNFLGVTVSGGVPAERYIAETWSIVGSSIPMLLLAAAALVLGGSVAYGTARLLRRFAPRLYGSLAALGKKSLPLLVVVALLVAELAVLRAISMPTECGTDILLGDLVAKNAAHCYQPRNGRPAFVIALIIVVATFIATSADKLTRVQFAARVFAVALALQLPAVYGYTIKPPQYRVVRADFDGGKTMGALMLETGESIQLWDAANGRGRIRVLPRPKSMEVGSTIDLLEAAATVAAKRRPDAFQQLCNERLSTGGP